MVDYRGQEHLYASRHRQPSSQVPSVPEEYVTGIPGQQAEQHSLQQRQAQAQAQAQAQTQQQAQTQYTPGYFAYAPRRYPRSRPQTPGAISSMNPSPRLQMEQLGPSGYIPGAEQLGNQLGMDGMGGIEGLELGPQLGSLAPAPPQQQQQQQEDWLYPLELDPVEQMEREMLNMVEPLPPSHPQNHAQHANQVVQARVARMQEPPPLQPAPAVPLRYQQWKPTSSIPPDMSSAHYAAQCIAAAEASRMPPFKLVPGEYNALRQHLSYRHVTTFLNIRNGILRLWMANPTVAVTLTEAAGCVRDERYYPMAEFSFEWLVRNGYINHGCFPRHASQFHAMNSSYLQRRGSKPRQTVAIVGAGIAGLAAARQLEALLQMYADDFAEYEDTPRVVLLEARKRIGGRIYTPRLSTIKTRVDLGADAVLGFGNGNPLGVLMRRQLGIPVMALDASHGSDPLYDGATGEPAPESRDYRAHGLFNHLLDKMRTFESGMVEPPSASGDKTLIQAGRDPSPDHGNEAIETIAHVEQRTRPYTTPLPDENDHVVDTRAETELLRELGFQPAKDTEANNDQNEDSEKTKEEKEEPKATSGSPTGNSVSASKIEIHAEPSGGAGTGSLGLTMRKFIDELQGLADIDEDDLAALDWYYSKFEYISGDDIAKQGLTSWSHHRRNRFSGRHSWARDGMAALCKGLDTVPTKLDVRFNTPITVIEYEDDSATVGFENGDQVNADRVVVTVPLGVLKKRSLQFIPDLPQWKINSIDRLSFGVVNKVCLVFDTLFWPADAGPVIRTTPPKTEKRGQCFIFENLAQRSGGSHAVIVGLISGEAASDLTHRSDREVVDEAVSRLRRIFASSPQAQTARLIESVVTRWQLDPYARGAYSYVGTDGTVVDHDLLSRPVLRSLFFAGEATSRLYPGTVHGAYLSGLRAAKEVLNSLIGPLEVPKPLILDPALLAASVTPPQHMPQQQLSTVPTTDGSNASSVATPYEVGLESAGQLRPGPPSRRASSQSTHQLNPNMVNSTMAVPHLNGSNLAGSNLATTTSSSRSGQSGQGPLAESNEFDDAETELLELRRRRLAAETEEMERELMSQLGEPPVRPERMGTTNPFLLFQKDYWTVCREETEAAKQHDRKGHATRNEIRVTLGKKWRSLPQSEKQPYVERSQRAKDSNEVKHDEYLRLMRFYEAEVDNFRQQWQQDHPSQPSAREVELERRVDELRPRRKRIRIRE